MLVSLVLWRASLWWEARLHTLKRSGRISYGREEKFQRLPFASVLQAHADSAGGWMSVSVSVMQMRRGPVKQRVASKMLFREARRASG